MPVYAGVFPLHFNQFRVSSALPYRLVRNDKSNPLSLFPIHRRLFALAKSLWTITREFPKAQRLLSKRFDDPHAYTPVGKRLLVGGNVEAPRRAKL